MSLRAIISAEIESLRKAMIVSIGGLAQQTKSDFIRHHERLLDLENKISQLAEGSKEYRHRIAQLEQRIEQLDTRLTMVAGNGNRMPQNRVPESEQARLAKLREG